VVHQPALLGFRSDLVISVIIPIRNGMPWLEEQVRALAAQECDEPWEVVLADNGSNWYISGAPDPRWDDDVLSTMKRVKGSDFEAVDTGPIVSSKR